MDGIQRSGITDCRSCPLRRFKVPVSFGVQRGGVGRDLRMRSEKSFAFPAACAASLM